MLVTCMPKMNIDETLHSFCILLYASENKIVWHFAKIFNVASQGRNYLLLHLPNSNVSCMGNHNSYHPNSYFPANLESLLGYNIFMEYLQEKIAKFLM